MTAAMLLIAAVPVRAFAAPLFEASYLAVPLGGNLHSLAAADFDEDGHLDVAAGDAQSGIRVALGSGDGTLAAAATYAAGPSPGGMIVRDLNGDDHVDLMVLNAGSNSVSFLAGHGDGSFDPPVSISTAPGARTFDLGDLDADGLEDLVVACTVANVISVRLGAGDATFGSELDLTLPTAPRAVAIAPLDADSIPDLVVTLPAWNGIATFRGNGDGTFQAAVIQAAGTTPDSVVVMDVDHDGWNDLVLTGASSLRVLRGKGDGTFGSGAWTALPADGGSGASSSIVVADVDADGLPDVVVTQPTRNRVAVLPGLAGGGFGTALDAPTDGWMSGVAVADLDEDGRPDLLTAHATGHVAFLHANGDRTFGSGTNLATGGPLFQIGLNDLTGDGLGDVIALSPTPWEVVSVFPGRSAGGFDARIDLPTGAPPARFATGDVDGDGVPDLVVTDGGVDSLSVFPGRGDGSFGSRTSFATGSLPEEVCLADFDGDGSLDLAATCFGNDQLWVHRGHGDGTFDAGVPYATGSQPLDVKSADFNGDMIPDLMVAAVGDHRLNVFLGHGNGTFDPVLRSGVCTNMIDLAIGDLNGDGDLDVVGAGARLSLDPPIVFLGAGDGTFTALDPPLYGVAAQQVECADLDGDGRLDLAVADRETYVTILLGNGDGTFHEDAYAYGPPYGAHRLSLGDADGDGFPDLVVSGEFPAEVTVLRNLRTPAAAAVPSGTTPGGAPPALTVTPNPARESVSLQLQLEAATAADLGVFDLSGRRVASPNIRQVLAGTASARWDLRTTAGTRVSPGVYFVTLSDGTRIVTGRVVVLR